MRSGSTPKERNLPKKVEINSEAAEKPLACLNAVVRLAFKQRSGHVPPPSLARHLKPEGAV